VNLKDGKEEGVRELFSPNGVLIERANYKDGKQDGPTERLGRDGEVIRTETWKDGVRIDYKRY
jgi:antitoxin component YwqK of YwqJK toxin-antitoxin module